jgi:hypothetical protein
LEALNLVRLLVVLYFAVRVQSKRQWEAVATHLECNHVAFCVLALRIRSVNVGTLNAGFSGSLLVMVTWER